MLEGKVAIVTGGTRGIGLAIVKKYLQEGACVVLFGSKEETVTKAIETLKNENGEYKVSGYAPDLTSEESVREIFERVEKQFGHIDILANNAGISSKTHILAYTEEEYENVVNVNIKSVFICSKVAVPYLKESKGVIINTSSMVNTYGQSSGVM